MVADIWRRRAVTRLGSLPILSLYRVFSSFFLFLFLGFLNQIFTSSEALERLEWLITKFERVFYYFYWVLLGFTGFFSGFLAELMTLNVADAPFQQVLTGTTCGRLCGFELVLPSFILCFLILVSEFS